MAKRQLPPPDWGKTELRPGIEVYQTFPFGIMSLYRDAETEKLWVRHADDWYEVKRP